MGLGGRDLLLLQAPNAVSTTTLINDNRMVRSLVATVGRRSAVGSGRVSGRGWGWTTHGARGGRGGEARAWRWTPAALEDGPVYWRSHRCVARRRGAMEARTGIVPPTFVPPALVSSVV